MNNLNDDVNKINRLKQKLYSRSITDNASKLNTLHTHNINVPRSWKEKEVIPEKDLGSKNIDELPKKQESVSDFLNNRFNNMHADDLSQERAKRLQTEMDKTTLKLKIAQAELDGKGQGIYSSLTANSTAQTNFQSDYHPDLKTIKIGDVINGQEEERDLTRLQKKKSKFTLGFFVFMITFFIFVGAATYAYITISKGTNIISTDKIDIKVTGPVSVKSGEITDFIIDITNNNTTDLILSDLIIQYPDGSKSPVDRNVDLNNERISVGTIRPGETVRQKNSVIFFGEQNAKKNIKYSYEFNINDSATIFTTEKNIGVFISGSPINISVNNVKEINNDQELTFDIILNSNTEEVLKNIQLRIEYPFGYRLLQSDPKPIFDNNTWSFDSIDSLSSTTIKLTGKFIGEINVDKNFRFILGVEDSRTKEMITVLSTQNNQVAIKNPFVVTRLLIDGDGSDSKSVTYDQVLKNDLIITNNLKDAITDVIIEVSLGGVLIDRRSISSVDGFYDSGRDIIFWDKSLNPGLIAIEPGASRELSFSLKTLLSDESLIRTLRRAVSDLTINVKAQRLGDNRVPENVVASTKKQLRLQTDVLFSSNLAYDSGTFSPEVNKEVIYKYVGNISNTANTIKDVVFTAKLPPNSIWKSSFSPNIPGSSVKYNQSTREITITLGDIEAGTGIDKPIKEFYFKIGFTPTLTQTGQFPITIMNPIITATDSFTGLKLQSRNASLTTDTTIGENSEVDGRVK